MKKIILFLILFLFVFCKSNKIDKIKKEDKFIPDTIVGYTYEDIFYMNEDLNYYAGTHKSSSLPEPIEYENNYYDYHGENYENQEQEKEQEKEQESSNKKSSLENLVVKDLTDDIDTIDNFGIIGYNIPNRFKVNVYSTIRLRITRENKVESVLLGDRNIPIVLKNSNDSIVLEKIEVDSLMSAKLYADKSKFEVSMVNSKNEQSLHKNGYTEWIWRVKPLKKGKGDIKLIIKVSGKDIIVYEKKIPVDYNWKYSISEWFNLDLKYILALIFSPILVPFFIWLYRRRYKNKSDKHDDIDLDLDF